MNRKLKYYRLVWLKHDLPAGLSVFFVALPLCLGIALASGAPLYAGLLSGIVGGMVVSLISGASLAVSGPAAGLTTLVAASILSLGDYKLFLLTVIVAGFIQVLMGILKLGVIANYFPSAVIKGMLAAIGIILIMKQIPVAIGYNKPDFWTTSMIHLISRDSFIYKLHDFKQNITIAAFLISVVSIIAIILFQQPRLKKIKIIPVPLIVVLLGIGMNLLLGSIFSNDPMQAAHLVNIPKNIFKEISFPEFSKIFSSKEIWKDGILIALLATLETLLCIEAIDKLDKRNHITPVNQELVAQGIGNMVCGVLGAIPITAVVVRGSANIDAGGRTKLSAFTHGLFLLLAVVFLPFLVNKIPYASLSAILLITGYNLTKPKLYRSMWSLGMKQFLPFIFTIFVILATDLLVGVTIGLLISIYFIIRNNFKAEYHITKTKQHETEVFVIKLNSNVSFLNKVNLKKSLDKIPEYSVLTIDGSECNFIDYDILEVISEFHNKAHERHIELHTYGIERVSVSEFH